jgi:hypothetical protein
MQTSGVDYCIYHLYAMILGKQAPCVAKYCNVGQFLVQYGFNIHKRDNWFILSKM